MFEKGMHKPFSLVFLGLILSFDTQEDHFLCLHFFFEKLWKDFFLPQEEILTLVFDYMWFVPSLELLEWCFAFMEAF